MPIYMVVFILQMTCDKGDCNRIMATIEPGFGSSSLLNSGSFTPKPKTVDQNIDIGAFPKEYPAEDLDGSLNPFKPIRNDLDFINNPPKE